MKSILSRFPRRTSDSSRPGRLRAELVDMVVDHLDGVDDPVIAVLGRGREPMARALRAAGAGWTILPLDGDASTWHLSLTLAGPVDVILDRPAPEGRHGRFRASFFHLRPGGLYVVPEGASEMGATPGPLGRHLQDAAALSPQPLRSGVTRPLPENLALAIRMHVTTRVAGDHLLLTHDLPDVLAKLDESNGDAWIEQSGAGHRVERRFPAVTPPSAAVITEGPEPRMPPMDRPVTAAPISMRDYRNVVVDVEQLVMTDRVVLPDTYRHNQWRRLVNRGVVDVGPLQAVPVRPVPEELPLLKGAYLHLDNEIRGHFGHTMTEVLSRMWSWPAAVEIDPDVRVLLTAARGRPEIAEWEYKFYEACGIPRERVVKVDGPVRVERLLSGSPMFSNPQFVHPAIVDTWDRVGDTLAAQAEQRERSKRIFIARRIKKRSCTNAEEVEALFSEYGFDIVYPEDYPLGEQVAMFRAAEVVAGYAGSGMFHIAFVPHPQRVIQIGSSAYTPRNEVLMAAIRGHRIDGVISLTDDTRVQAPFAVDMEREGPYLRSILENL